MKITLLGTGTSQGVPVIACECEVCRSPDPHDNRLRSAIMIEDKGTCVVVDAGPDFRQQMLREKVRNVDAILLTHEHADHIFGLDDIRSFNWVRKAPMDIYCEARVDKNLRSIFEYVFSEEKYPGIPQMNLVPINGLPLTIGALEIVPVRVMHHQLPVYGFRVGKFAYLTDFSTIADEELEKLNGVEVLVIDALRKESHISHLSLSEAITIINKINPCKAYITHISHQMGLHNEVMKELPEGVELGYDGEVLILE